MIEGTVQNHHKQTQGLLIQQSMDCFQGKKSTLDTTYHRQDFTRKCMVSAQDAANTTNPHPQHLSAHQQCSGLSEDLQESHTSSGYVGKLTLYLMNKKTYRKIYSFL